MTFIVESHFYVSQFKLGFCDLKPGVLTELSAKKEGEVESMWTSKTHF